MVAANGNAYTVDANHYLPSDVTIQAMVAYKNGNNGLAIALADEGSMNWNTAKNTAAAHTPTITGGTWKLPSQDDWKNMFTANGGSIYSYTGLNKAITTAGGTALQYNKYYWSSYDHGGGYAGTVLIYDGVTFANGVTSKSHQVRACLAF